VALTVMFIADTIRFKNVAQSLCFPNIAFEMVLLIVAFALSTTLLNW
jgi:hypothetical protein